MKIIIAAICVIAVVACACLVVHKIKNSYVDGPGMENKVRILSIEYYYGQDEYGRSTSLNLQKDGKITYYENVGTTGNSSKQSCTSNEELTLALEQIASEYDIRSWADLPKSDIQVLDGPTTSFKITFADGTLVCLGDDYQMPDGSWAAVNEICTVLETYIKENADNNTETIRS